MCVCMMYLQIWGFVFCFPSIPLLFPQTLCLVFVECATPCNSVSRGPFNSHTTQQIAFVSRNCNVHFIGIISWTVGTHIFHWYSIEPKYCKIVMGEYLAMHFIIHSTTICPIRYSEFVTVSSIGDRERAYTNMIVYLH